MNELANYGVLGVVLIVFAIWYAKKDRQHKEERESTEKMHREERGDWKKTIEKQFEESNKVTKENTNIVSELSTLIKTIKK